MNKMKHKMTSMKMIVAFASLAALSACSGGDGSITIGSTSSSSSGEPGSIAVTEFKGTAQSSWQIESGTGAIQTATGAISFAGTCTRGVNKIIVKSKVHSVGTYTDTGITADCLNQTFSWTGTALSSDNYYDYQLYGVNGSGVEQTDKAVVKAVKFDSTPPADPSAITVNSTSVGNGSSITLVSTDVATIDGTISNDTKRVIATTSCAGGNFGGVTDFTNIGAFHYTITIPAGATCAIAFKAYDDLENMSGTYSINVSYTQPLASNDFNMSFNSGANFTVATNAGITLLNAGVASFEGSATSSPYDFRAGVVSYLGQAR